MAASSIWQPLRSCGTANGGAYTGRFFRTPFSLCPCSHDGLLYNCVVSRVVVPAVSAVSAAWPEATDGLWETALATAPATRPPVAMPPLARLTRAHTAVHG